MRKLLTAALSATILGAAAASAVEIRDGDVILNEKFGGTVMQFEPGKWPGDAHGVMLTVETLESKSRGSKVEEDFLIKLEFGKDIPAVDLSKLGHLVDGTYVYEITGGTDGKIKKDEGIDNGRGGDESDFDVVGFALSGHFIVDRGQIVVFEQGEEKGSEKPVDGEPVEDNDGGESKPENKGRDSGGKEEPGGDLDKG